MMSPEEIQKALDLVSEKVFKANNDRQRSVLCGMSSALQWVLEKKPSDGSVLALQRLIDGEELA